MRLSRPLLLIAGAALMVFFAQYYARFIVYSAYNFPTGDDLGYTNLTRRLGVLPMVVQQYTTIIGRYTALLILGLVGRSDDVVMAVRIYNILIYLLLLGGMTSLLYAVFKPLQPYRLPVAFGGACMILVLFLGFITYPWEVYFWTAATSQYQFAFTCTLFLLALIWYCAHIPAPLYLITGSLLILLTAGTVEVISMLQPAMLVSLGLFEWFRLKRVRRDMVWFCIVAVTGMLIVALAPGNTARYGGESVSGLEFKLQYFLQAAYHLASVIFRQAPIFGAAVLALLPIFAKIVGYYRPQHFIRWPGFLLLLSGGALAFYMVFLLPVIMQHGVKLPDRGIFAALFFLWLYVLFYAWLGFALLQPLLVRLSKLTIPAAGAVGLAACVVVLAGYSYVRYLAYDFATLEAFDASNRERMQIMAQAVAEGRDTAVLPPLKARPALLLYWDIADENIFGYREQYARVFGLKDVSVAE